jgi:hypothetical protein
MTLSFSHNGEIVRNNSNDITLEIQAFGDFACLYRHSKTNEIHMDVYTNALPIPFNIHDKDGNSVTSEALSEMMLHGLSMLKFDKEDIHIHNMAAYPPQMNVIEKATTRAMKFLSHTTVRQKHHRI